MNSLMNLSFDLIEKLEANELLFINGGSALDSEAKNNGGEVCDGKNSGGDLCGSRNNGGNWCGGKNNGGGSCHEGEAAGAM